MNRLVSFFAILSIVILTMCTGCSLVLMSKVPHEYSPRYEPNCSGCALPVVDGVVALGVGTFSVWALAAGLGSDGSEPCGEGDGFCFDMDLRGPAIAMGLVMLIPTILYSISAIVGANHAGKCYDARDAHRKWLDMSSEEKKQFEEQWRKGQKKRTRKIKDESKVESFSW